MSVLETLSHSISEPNLTSLIGPQTRSTIKRSASLLDVNPDELLTTQLLPVKRVKRGNFCKSTSQINVNILTTPLQNITEQKSDSSELEVADNTVNESVISSRGGESVISTVASVFESAADSQDIVSSILDSIVDTLDIQIPEPVTENLLGAVSKDIDSGNKDFAAIENICSAVIESLDLLSVDTDIGSVEKNKIQDNLQTVAFGNTVILPEIVVSSVIDTVCNYTSSTITTSSLPQYIVTDRILSPRVTTAVSDSRVTLVAADSDIETVSLKVIDDNIAVDSTFSTGSVPVLPKGVTFATEPAILLPGISGIFNPSIKLPKKRGIKGIFKTIQKIFVPTTQVFDPTIPVEKHFENGTQNFSVPSVPGILRQPVSSIVLGEEAETDLVAFDNLTTSSTTATVIDLSLVLTNFSLDVDELLNKARGLTPSTNNLQWDSTFDPKNQISQRPEGDLIRETLTKQAVGHLTVKVDPKFQSRIDNETALQRYLRTQAERNTECNPVTFSETEESLDSVDQVQRLNSTSIELCGQLPTGVDPLVESSSLRHNSEGKIVDSLAQISPILSPFLSLSHPLSTSPLVPFDFKSKIVDEEVLRIDAVFNSVVEESIKEEHILPDYCKERLVEIERARIAETDLWRIDVPVDLESAKGQDLLLKFKLDTTDPKVTTNRPLFLDFQKPVEAGSVTVTVPQVDTKLGENIFSFGLSSPILKYQPQLLDNIDEISNNSSSPILQLFEQIPQQTNLASHKFLGQWPTVEESQRSTRSCTRGVDKELHILLNNYKQSLGSSQTETTERSEQDLQDIF